MLIAGFKISQFSVLLHGIGITQRSPFKSNAKLSLKKEMCTVTSSLQLFCHAGMSSILWHKLSDLHVLFRRGELSQCSLCLHDIQRAAICSCLGLTQRLETEILLADKGQIRCNELLVKELETKQRRTLCQNVNTQFSHHPKYSVQIKPSYLKRTQNHWKSFRTVQSFLLPFSEPVAFLMHGKNFMQYL